MQFRPRRTTLKQLKIDICVEWRNKEVTNIDGLHKQEKLRVDLYFEGCSWEVNKIAERQNPGIN